MKTSRPESSIRKRVPARPRGDEMEFLSRSAMAFLELPYEGDLYELIAQRLGHRFESGTVAAVLEYEEVSGVFQLRAVHGLEPIRGKIRKALGQDIKNLPWVFGPRARRALATGKWTLVKSGVRDFPEDVLPRARIEALEKALGLSRMYVIGFKKGGRVFGGLALFPAGERPVQDASLMEAFAGQAAVALERRRTEESLRESEDKFRRISDAAEEGIWVADESDLTTFVNGRMAEMLGYAAEEIIGRSSTPFLFPEDRGDHDRKIEDRRQGRSGRYERRWRRKDGTSLWTLVSAVPLHDAAGRFRGSFGMITDITDRTRTEEAVRKSEAFQRQAIENAGGVSFQLIFGSELGSGQYINMSANGEDLFGVPVADFTERRFWDLVQEVRPVTPDLPTDPADVRALYLEGKIPSYKADVRFRTPDGREKWIQDTSLPLKDPKTGRIIGVQGILIDITARKRIEEDLKENERRYHLLFEGANDAILILNGEQFVECNDMALKLYGCAAREDIIGRTVADFSPPLQPDGRNSRDKASALIDAALAGEPQRFVWEHLRKDGKRISVEVALSRLPLGHQTLLQAIIHDISETIQAEKLQNALYQIAKAAETSASLNDLYKSVHEIIGTVMPARNFYISLYDVIAGEVTFPYFVDEMDERPASRKIGKGVTDYVFRTGASLLCDEETDRRLVERGEIELIGHASPVWLGVPLRVENTCIGVMALQHYSDPQAYGPDDLRMLEYVSSQVARSIERKRAEEQLVGSLKEKEILVREIHHRVKNNMQIISSLLRLQSGQVKDQEVLGMLRVCQSRILAMSLVHEKLYSSRDLNRISFSDYIRSLVVDLLHQNRADSNAIRLKLDLEEVFLDIQTAIPCGLIINELITNALKHAFPDGRTGEIRVGLRALEERGYELIVQDSGVGVPEGFNIRNPKTLGFQIMTMLVDQLDGSIKVARDGGTTIRIHFKELRYKPRV